MFIEICDFYTSKRIILNTDDISRIEERNDANGKAYCAIYFRTVTDDFDGTKRQSLVYALNSYEDIQNKISPK